MKMTLFKMTKAKGKGMLKSKLIICTKGLILLFLQTLPKKIILNINRKPYALKFEKLKIIYKVISHCMSKCSVLYSFK